MINEADETYTVAKVESSGHQMKQDKIKLTDRFTPFFQRLCFPALWTNDSLCQMSHLHTLRKLFPHRPAKPMQKAGLKLMVPTVISTARKRDC